MGRDRLWNNVLVVLTIFAIGACLILFRPFRVYLDLARDQIRAGRPWLPLVAGIAYVLGFFVTRTVEDSFDAIFGKPPFSDIGQKGEQGQSKHPPWIDRMLRPLGYALCFARIAVILAILLGLLWAALWLVSRGMGANVGGGA